MVAVDCLQKAAMKHLSKGDSTELKNIMLKLFNERQKVHQPELRMLEKIFNFHHESNELIKSVKEQLLLGNFQWSAKVKITIVEAIGLLPKDNNGLSDPYCLVQVGRNVKKTSTKKKMLNPVWHETFDFKADSARESIKIRIWDEDDDLRSRLKDKLLRESDDFLGQVIIDIRSIAGNTDSWYDLRPRTTKSEVQGSIRIKIVMETEKNKREEEISPLTTQYTFIQNSIMEYLMAQSSSELIDNVEGFQFKDPQAQAILDSFTGHYGILKIFQALGLWAHFVYHDLLEI